MTCTEYNIMHFILLVKFIKKYKINYMYLTSVSKNYIDLTSKVMIHS